MSTLLFEIGMEECPARFIPQARADLERLLKKGLSESRLAFGDVKTYATPRRLAVVVAQVASRQEDVTTEVKGPPARIAFAEDGSPTKAAIGFAANQGVDVSELEIKDAGGASYVYATKREKGKSAEEILPGVLQRVVEAMRFPKSMRWNDSGLRFARPIRWLVALLDDRVVELEVGGVRASNVTYGHRFLSDGAIPLERAADYVEVLRERGKVFADVDSRRESVKEQVEAVAASAGGQAAIDPELLEEVTNLVEHPTALVGAFDERYLAVPQEILVTSMREHQRYFPVYSPAGELMPLFVAVRNGSAEHIDIVRAGNEKVLSARLADAKFFYDEDLKTPLADRVEDLKHVVFQEKLGTVWEKQERARSVARAVSASYPDATRQAADRAIALAKADLVTQVVYEFPELQGVMGKEYALRSGEDPAVALAIYEHYLPRYADDELPKSDPGILAAVSDKIDTIVGCFGIGLIPTGSADPYALRRQALGIIRITLQHRVPFALGELIDAALRAYADRFQEHDRVKEEVLEFFRGRLQALLIDEGIRHDLVDAALAIGVEDLTAAYERALALSKAAGTERFLSLLTAFQRSANLASKAQGTTVDPSVFEHPEERALWERALSLSEMAGERVRAGKYVEAIEVLADLRAPVDAFFEAVLVMADDPRVRENRLATLAAVVAATRPIGDLAKVVGG